MPRRKKANTETVTKKKATVGIGTGSNKMNFIAGKNPDDAFNAMIGQNEVKATDTKNGKKEAPVIQLPEELHKNLKSFLQYKNEKKTAETNMRTEEAPLLEHCRNIQDENALAGNFVATYKVVGEDGQAVSFVTQDKHSLSQDKEVHDNIKESVGDEEYGNVVETKTTVRLKDEVFTDKALKAKLIELVGSCFGEFFVTETKKVLKPGFNKKVYELSGGEQDKVDELRGLIPQSKPFFK